MLYLLPNVLGDIDEHSSVLPISVDRAVASLDHLIAESEKEGRRFLKRFSALLPHGFREIPIHLLNEHTSAQQRKTLSLKVAQGQTWGLISDCGMPCFADPGEELIFHARCHGVPIKAFVGPSSIMLALLLSGLGGQRFTFMGYLSKQEQGRIREFKEMQKRSLQEQAAYLFIEAPYRNAALLAQLLHHLDSKTWLCTATDLTLPTESVMTKTVQQWRTEKTPQIDKRPTVFILRVIHVNSAR